MNHILILRPQVLKSAENSLILRNSAEQVTNTCLMGVLVAISIPIFTSQLEKAREATDAANIRSAYAEVSAAILTDDKKDSADGIVKYKEGTYSATVSTAG